MRWRAKINGTEPKVDIRMDTALPGVHDERGTFGYAEFQTLAHDTRAIALVHSPATALERVEPKPGDAIWIESVIDAQARAGQATWNGQLRLAE